MRNSNSNLQIILILLVSITIIITISILEVSASSPPVITTKRSDTTLTVYFTVDPTVKEIFIVVNDNLYSTTRNDTTNTFFYTFSLDSLEEGQLIDYIILYDTSQVSYSFTISLTDSNSGKDTLVHSKQDQNSFDIFNSEMITFYLPLFLLTSFIILRFLFPPNTVKQSDTGDIPNE